MNYYGIITKIKDIQNHPNADKLNIGKASNFNVIISKNIQENQLGVFFPEGGTLSKEFLQENNLYRHSQLNKDTTQSGLFDDNGRIKAAKIRGSISEGIWLPINCLNFTNKNFTEKDDNFKFQEINKIKICKKYITPATKRTNESKGSNSSKNKVKIAKVFPSFKEHFDTQQLQYCIDTIKEGQKISITEKCHGTSGRTGYLLKYPEWMFSYAPFFPNLKILKPIRNIKLINLYIKELIIYLFCKTKSIIYKNIKPKYAFVSGTRRTILNLRNMIDGYYENCNFRTAIHKFFEENVKLKKGETIYYEICGFTDSKAAIMGTHKVPNSLKEIKKQYGDSITYTYGCSQHDLIPYKIFVYRITQIFIDENGLEHTKDLMFNELVKRIAELNLKYVPILKEEFIYNGNKEKLLKECEELATGPSVLDDSHIKEGVVLKIDDQNNSFCLKYKSFDFKVIEGIIKEDPNYIDEEEINS